MSDFDNDWRRRRDQFDPDDDYHTFEDEEDDGLSRRRAVILVSIAVLILVFGGVVFLAYRQGINQVSTGEPPILRADNSPDKVVPENPGGTTVPHQDKTIYDRIARDNESSEENVEHLLPRAEEPVEVKKAEEAAPAIEAAPLTPPAAESAAPVAEAGTPANIIPPASQQADAANAGQPVAAPVEPAPVEEPKPVEQPTTPMNVSGGGFVVQLAALRDEATALSTFKKLQAKFPGELGSLASDIERADLGEKGIYFRLRAGPLNKAQAQTICTALSAQGQGCFVKAK